MSADTTEHKFSGTFGISNFNDSSADMVGISIQELESNRELAEQALFANRTDLRTKGYQVEALERKATLQKNLSNNNDLSNDQAVANSTNGIEAHPELPFMGGKADQVFIPGIEDLNELDGYEAYLSESQKDQIAAKKRKKQQKQQEKLKNQFKNRISNTPKQQPKNTYKYKQKIENRSRPLPKPTPF